MTEYFDLDGEPVCFEQSIVCRLEVPPGLVIEVQGYDVKTYELCLLPEVIDGKPTRAPTVDSHDRSKSFPLGLCVVQFPRRRLPWPVVRDVATMYVISEFHEALEFVRFNGSRLADPHPDPSEVEHWDWLAHRLGRVIADYQTAFPMRPHN